MQNNRQYFEDDDTLQIKSEMLRYVSFWPYLILLIIFFSSLAFLFLRYSTSTLTTKTVIEILDESQNSEMALPTELTVFNRSMINLENEINILNSFSLNSAAVKQTNTNILFYERGRVKDVRTTSEMWYDDYKLDFKIDTDLIEKKSSFTISTSESKLKISVYNENNEFVKSLNFNSLSTLNTNHELPFDLIVVSDENLDNERRLKLISVKDQANSFRNKLQINALGDDSDQLSLSLTYENAKIAQKYLNALTRAFDNDGILDRQLEYSRTIEFVNQREKILKNDLDIVEQRKQNYKQENNLSDINLDANFNLDLKSNYDSEIFQTESQKQIAEYLVELTADIQYGYLPINIGLDNFDLNNLISEYNKVVSERYRFLNEAGSNNFLVKSLEEQLDNLIKNISLSLDNFTNSLEIKIENLKLKEAEFDYEYNRVPENEKTLRAIERELQIKESLYLLLLQKREEASINLAVVKPTVKIIDYAITDLYSKKPDSRIIYFAAFAAALLLYFSFLYLRFFLDDKVHNKEQLLKLLDDNIPIIGEIPFLDNPLNIKNDASSRSIISESIRMILSNLRFVSSLNSDFNEKSQTIIFTSSIKGEGKTLASVNTASNLANDLNKDKKVILLGSDLRNPQIHKNFGVEKNQIGISEIVYKKDLKNYKKYIKKFENLDVLFSGAIPPNPTALLSSDIFKELISLLKNEYDYIIIDSAPCLLVSDTFQFIDQADSVVYLFRSNFTDSKISNFINEIYNTKNIKNLNIVFNAVGNSAAYGYKYGYQYGYKYGYNYGYGYGYEADKK